MLRPSMYQIIDKHDSYYEFVVAVAQRARDIADSAEKGNILLEEKPVNMALQDFASGRIKVNDYI